MSNSNTDLPQAKLDSIRHRGEDWWRLRFDYNSALISFVKSLGARWSASHRAWLFARARIDHRTLAASLSGRMRLLDSSSPMDRWPPITPSQEDRLHAFRGYLQQKRYSANTVRTYTEMLRLFMRYRADAGADDLSSVSGGDINRFNLEFMVRGGYSRSYQNQMVSALKLYFRSVEARELHPDQIDRPRREHRLPHVLSKTEVKRLLEGTYNLKHRCMLSLIYACGLRRGELLGLKLTDVDKDRRVLWVRGGKGAKDRMLPLSEKILALLEDYLLRYKPAHWVIEGVQSGQRYSEGSLRKVFKQAVERAKVNSTATLHWLRHSYATHLLESGTDLRYIQELLGHRSSRTTEIYTHVSKRAIDQIRSPFDDL